MNKTTEKRSLAGIAEQAFKILLIVLMVIYCLSLLICFVWVVISSFRTYIDFTLHAFALPEEWTFDNYKEAFRVFNITLKAKNGSKVLYGIDSMFIYSVIYSVSRTFVSVALYACMAYAMAKYNFFGKNFLYSLGIFVMITPIIGSQPSLMQLKKDMGVYNSMLASILTCNSTAFAGMHFLLLYGAFKSLPWAYAESALIDGGNHWTVFFKIMLPMMLPTCAVIYVLEFLAIWNDYSTFLIWLPSYPSLSLGLFIFQNDASRNMVGMPTVLSAFIIVMIPTIILYLASQKLIMERFNVGGLKG